VAECLTEHKSIALAAAVAEASRALGGEAALRVDEAFSRSLLPARLTQLLDAADDEAAQHALALIEALPDTCLAGICSGLGRVTHRERRRLALDLLLARGLPGVQVIATMVRDGEGAFVLDLVAALARVPPQARVEGGAAARSAGRGGGHEPPYSTTGAAVREGLISGIAHRDSHVRFESLRHLLASTAVEEGAQHAAIALVDSEAAVRRVAQEYLIQLAPPEAGPALERLVRDAKFGKRDLGERRRLLLAYGRSGGTPAVKLLIDVLEKRRKDPDELREAAAEVLAILGASPARPVLERIAQNKKDDERVRAAAAKAAQAIARKCAVTNFTPSRPLPAFPEPAPKPPHVPPETSPIGPRPRVATPLPFTIVGTPRPSAPSEEGPIVVGEEPLWQDEPVRREQPAPEIAALLQDYLSKTDPPASKPWSTPTAPSRDPSATLAAVKLVKKKKSDQNSDE
jgi:hypothetical protein